MKRIVKKPDVRRLEIMKAAEKLFEKKGYANTSVESIIEKVGIAKGTFYHYFKAKQDILEALVEQLAGKMEMHFNSILAREDLTALQKLKMMFRGPEKKKMTSSSVVKILHKPENRELEEKLAVTAVKIIAPIIAKVLEQGKEQGIFTQAPPVEAVQLGLAGSQFILDSGLFDLTSAERKAYLKSTQHLFELLVGVKAGYLSFISEE